MDNPDWTVQVVGDSLQQPFSLAYQDFERMAEITDVTSYLPDHRGEVVLFDRFQKALPLIKNPRYYVFHGSDRFSAAVMTNELTDAFFVYKQAGKPLQKGYPLRLYVPNGASTCLNVKSIVTIEVSAKDDRHESSFGFKNTFEPGELLTQNRK